MEQRFFLVRKTDSCCVRPSKVVGNGPTAGASFYRRSKKNMYLGTLFRNVWHFGARIQSSEFWFQSIMLQSTGVLYVVVCTSDGLWFLDTGFLWILIILHFEFSSFSLVLSGENLRTRLFELILRFSDRVQCAKHKSSNWQKLLSPLSRLGNGQILSSLKNMFCAPPAVFIAVSSSSSASYDVRVRRRCVVVEPTDCLPYGVYK